MNIFFLDHDPELAAQYLVDIHTGSRNCGGKMIVETAQMLANCYTKEELEFAPRTKDGNVRGYSYYNHCCSRWVRESLDNFTWLVKHGKAMVSEKIYRGGKLHFCGKFIDWCDKNPPMSMSYNGFTRPALAVGKFVHLRLLDDYVDTYRQFYVLDKKFDKNMNRMDIYTNRTKPFFWNETGVCNV